MLVLEGPRLPLGGKRYDGGVGVSEGTEVYLGERQNVGRISPEGDVELTPRHKDLG